MLAGQPHSTGWGSFWVRRTGPPRGGVSLKAGAFPACGPAPVGKWGEGGRCAQGIRFPTGYSCPDLGPALGHRLSYNLRAKIERGSGRPRSLGGRGQGRLRRCQGRAGSRPPPPREAGRPNPSPVPRSTPPSCRTGSQDLRVGRHGEQEAPGTLPTLFRQTGGETRLHQTQTCPRSPSMSGMGVSPGPEGVPWPPPHLPWV